MNKIKLIIEIKNEMQKINDLIHQVEALLNQLKHNKQKVNDA